MWRSLLFIPVLEERFIAKAAERGADALVLDLEASIAPDRKDEARAALPGIVERLAPQVAVTVRINPLWMATLRDLDAAVIEGVQAVHLALCESAEHVRAVDGIVSDLEAERGLPVGQIKLIAMLETADAVCQAAEIAKASPRLMGMTLGVEDYITSMGGIASENILRPAAFQVIQAARSGGLEPFLVPASMADYGDSDVLENAANYAKSLGSVGGYAVHPSQVAVLNTVFFPSEDAIVWARDVVAVAEIAQSEGKGAFKVKDQMIDGPLIERAKRILAQLE